MNVSTSVRIVCGALLLGSLLFAGRAYAQPELLGEPVLGLPEPATVAVAWYTEWEGTNHFATVDGVEYPATSMKLTRKLEDANSQLFGESPGEVVVRDIWRHEALITGLTPNQRFPYTVTSVDGDNGSVTSDTFSLQRAPEAGTGMKIVLTSDQQNRAMSPAAFQKLEETVGIVDAVLFAGDFVDNPHRASEWWDRNNEGRPAFFPSLQGYFQELFPEHPYNGGEILQHAWLFGTIGNHETPGRWRPNETFLFGDREQTASINSMDGDPQPRWFAEIRFAQKMESGELTVPDGMSMEAFRTQWVRDNSFEHTAYFEMWTQPEGPEGESYYAIKVGDVFIISMNVSRVWRNWNPGRGKFHEDARTLEQPDEWGFGDMFFAHYNFGTPQYEWLVDQLESDAFKSSKYRIVLGHQTMFGLGDNTLPVMADPIMYITYTDGDGAEQVKVVNTPFTRATWETEIEPLIGSITNINYTYPISEDIWTNDIEPLLLDAGVDLVHTGHSHLWNRSRVENLNYIETSNYGNSFGAGWGNIVRAPWARFPESVFPWRAEDYPRTGDPQGRMPIYPNVMNPEDVIEDQGVQPYVSSNNVAVFTVFDTASGLVESWAFDTREPDSDVMLIDSFPINAEEDPSNFPFAQPLGDDWKFGWMGFVWEGSAPWVYSLDHGWLLFQPGDIDGDITFYDPDAGWLSTTMDLYPAMWADALGAWVFYFEGTKNPRQFFNFSTGEYFELP